MSNQQAALYEPLPATPRSYARPGGPNGYGAAVWPPPVPDRRGAGRGRVVAGVAIGALILACTLLGGFLLLTGGGSKAAGGAAARYRLTAPEHAAGFRRDAPAGRTFRTDHLERLRRLGVRDAGSVTAGYSSARGKLMFSGVWGEVRNPERAVDGMFEAMAEDARREPVRQGAREEVVGSPERVSVDGAVMKCQPVSFTPAEGEPGASLTLPYCVWADHSTLGVVGAALGERTAVPEAAEAAGELRRAARTPR
ncbi:hypothetical protein B7P34_16460 [Streptosporangium nondiastaticum]|uniref:Uncharacterized protein n=1 Tax=Streptosporangium nondiastaticum TaxID=35764 RepID=A0A9X7JQ69_9ACTN|nr:hypothetical protein [Streptosporangium nondiastaticum]PSJ27644.1 hypothetical protein B7P34_16460 [Streptosporangium nondiastaticum]